MMAWPIVVEGLRRALSLHIHLFYFAANRAAIDQLQLRAGARLVHVAISKMRIGGSNDVPVDA
jgi:hypothetical protein